MTGIERMTIEAWCIQQGMHPMKATQICDRLVGVELPASYSALVYQINKIAEAL